MSKSLLILIIILIFIIVISRLIKNDTNIRENFKNPKRQIVIPSNDNIYDKFYSSIYDKLFGDKAKLMFEVKEIKKHALKKWGKQENIRILDAGCGTGWHTNILSKDYNIIGVDRSAHMINEAKKRNNSDVLKLGNINNPLLFERNSFTHIICLYHTIYYINDLNKLFKNFRKWLGHNGILVIHVVDRNNFDPLVKTNKNIPYLIDQHLLEKDNA